MHYGCSNVRTMLRLGGWGGSRSQIIRVVFKCVVKLESKLLLGNKKVSKEINWSSEISKPLPVAGTKERENLREQLTHLLLIGREYNASFQ